DLEINHLYGLALLVTGRPAMAVWPLRKASLSDEFAVRDGSLLARALLAGGSSDDAINAADRILELEPDNLEMLRLRLEANLESMKNDDALADVDRILALKPDDLPSRLARVKARLNLNQEEEADLAIRDVAETLDRIEDEKLRSRWLPRVCGASATFAHERGDPDGAEAVWADCLAKYPEEKIILLAAMEFFDSLGQPARAVAILRGAQALRPTDMQIVIPLAMRLNATGRQKEADAFLKQATDTNPDNIQTWLSLAKYHDERDEPKEARDAVRQALNRMQDAPVDLVAAYAELLIRSGDFDQLPEVMALLEEEPLMLAMLGGRLELSRGHPTEALVQLEEGLRLWPSSSAARYLAGQAHEQLGNYDAALRQYLEAHRADQANPEATFRLTQLLEDMGRGPEALPVLNRYHRSNPGDSRAPLAILRIGNRSGNRASVNSALRILDQQPYARGFVLAELARVRQRGAGTAAAAAMIEESGLNLTRPSNSEALDQLVQYLAELARTSEGLELAQAAASAWPDSAAFNEIHGRALRASGSPEPARQALEQSLVLEPERASALAELALLTAEQGDSAAAAALYDRAAEAQPDTPDYAWRAVQLVAASGDRADAQRRLENLVRHHGNHTEATQRLALLLVEEDPDRALKLARQAIRFQGGSDALDTLGRIHLQRGEIERATRHLERSLELRPGSASTHFWLGQARAASGDTEAARTEFLEALENPSFPQREQARAALAGLKTGT
ncbi:MAG: tetratricopeptide repeat protein, partial [Myxococcota bacterium]